VSSAAGISSDVSVALSLGMAQRVQPFAAQPDAQPFAALLDAAAPPSLPTSDGGANGGTPAAAAPANQQAPPAENGTAPQAANAASAAAANTGASTPSPPGKATSGAGAPPKWAPIQGAAAGASVRLPSAGNATSGAGAPPKDTSVQNANAEGARKGTATSRGLADRSSGTAGANAAAKTVPAPALTGDGDTVNATSNTTPNATNNGPAQGANKTATPDSTADGGTDAASSATGAAAFNAAVNSTDPASTNGMTPVATKTAGGKDGQNDGAADSANDSSQLPQLNAAPVAVAMIGNAAIDAAPSMTKAGATVAEAVKARPKAMSTAATASAGQNTPAQGSDTDPTASASATDSGATEASTSSGSDATTGSNSTSTMSAQQTPDQPQVTGTATATLLSAFASSGAARSGEPAGATASLNGAGVSAAPAASANSAVAPNFGVFATNATTTNGAVPAAAGSATAVPLAGLAVAIAARAQAGSSQFDIRLDPPELGRIDVRLGVDGSGQVTTHVTVDRADTLQLLQSQQPQLQQALEQAGLKTADNGLQFTLRDQSFAGQNGGSGGQQQQAAPPPQLVIPEPDVAPIDTAQIYARLRLGNGLDIRV
jgi:flagellar hook-length control protein FliK